MVRVDITINYHIICETAIVKSQTFYYRLINVLPNICKQNAHIFTQILYTKCNYYFSYSLAETFSWCMDSITVGIWVRISLSNRLERNCNFLIKSFSRLYVSCVSRPCSLVLSSFMTAVTKRLVFQFASESSGTSLLFSHQTLKFLLSNPILFLALFPSWATWQLFGSLCHHAPLKVQQTVFCWS